MLQVTLRTLLARKLRLALTAAAIALGVTFVTGTLVLTDTSSRLFDQHFARASSGVDAVVRDATASALEMGPAVERTPVPADVVERIRRTAGVARAEGVASGTAPLVLHGRPVVAGDASVGTSWADAPFSPFRIQSGRAPRGPGDVVIDEATAVRAAVRLGETVGVARGDRTHRYTLVGTARFGDDAGIPGTSVALFSPRAAQTLFDLGDGWSEVRVVADAIPAEELERRLSAELGDRVVVATSQDIAAARAQDARRQMAYLTGILAILALTSVIVGSFMIANTFAIVIAQRTREFGTLRALGATARQVRRSVVLEAVLVGTVASAAGVALGLVAASGLRRLARTFGVVVPDGPMVVLPRTLAVGVVIGIGVTLVAALAPSRRAGRVSPVAAMRDSGADPRPLSRRRGWAGLVLLTAGSALLAVAVAITSVPLVGLAAGVVLTATVLLGPSFAGRLAAVMGSALGRGAVTPRLARVNVQRAPRRTAATSSALGAGLAVVCFMTVVATSAQQAVSRGIDEVILADLVIESSGGVMGGLPPDLHRRVSELPAVDVVSRLRHGHWQTSNGATKPLTAMDPATLAVVAKLDLLTGDIGGLRDGGLVVTRRSAAQHGLAVGDHLAMTFARTGARSLRVVGVLDDRDAWPLGTDYLVSLETFAEHFVDDVDATMFLELADGADPDRARQAVQTALEDFPTAVVVDQTDLKARETESFDEVLGLVRVLLLLTVVIALLGITNSLALSIVERTREIGMLRAVGMTRRQIGRLIRIEAALTAAVGAVTGTVLGTAIAAAMVHALADTKVIDLSLPVGALATYLLAAGLGGILAGVLPSRRAARMEVLSAISTA